MTMRKTLAGTPGTTLSHPGVAHCTDIESLQAALASGIKQILVGRSSMELSSMLPLPHLQDILHLVGESRLLHGETVAQDIASTLLRKVQLREADKPKLALTLSELIQNAIEHGNLGLSQVRTKSGEDLDAFVVYQEQVTNTLNGPVGRIPLRVSCRVSEGMLRIEIEDRGMGFRIREVMARETTNTHATGRGIGMLHKLLGGNLSYDNGGRIVRFQLPLEQPNETNKVQNLREKARVVAWASNAARTPLLERALRSAGINHLHVLTSLRDLMSRLNSCDLVVLDGDTPNFATLAYTLRDIQKEAPHLPALLWASRAIEQTCTMALSFGAVDVITMQSGAEIMALRIERLLQQLSVQNTARKRDEIHQEELERTRVFQQEMLPKSETLTRISQQHHLQIGVSYLGCETLAGDYWFANEYSPHEVAFGVMDFTGHGVRAALNTVQLHAILKSQWKMTNPTATAMYLNHQLCQLLGPGYFAAYVYLILNTQTGDISYCAGGAPAMLVKSAKGIVKEIPCSGLPLGLTLNLTPTLRTAKLEPGESLLMVSDGFTDAPHKNDQRWGPEGLSKSWQKIPAAMQARQALQSLTDHFHKTVKLPVPDDLTALVIKRP